MWQTVLGGVLALAGGFGVAFWQARQQARLARDEDLRDRRSELYLDLLTNLSGRVSYLEDRWYGPRNAEDWELRKQLDARIVLFASPEVRDLWKAATAAALNLHSHTIEGGLLENDGSLVHDAGQDPTYARLEDEHERTRAALEQHLRGDLGADSLPAP
ncbi:hypothetical protein QMZ92_30640 [Streptomyces sp. HNM0645]|uniref:hypothetical protein n=1 Tax=Streptomyces sp. HNM0645 TaxID=2782343 RepID=UPI0024B758FC|nr:hypothetical protein [Streptomyces sp. HNM0645]MDI9888604.1 hypothetical protein [Streptomyces sp. HNM0645]